jgi:hypothetical protein
MATVENKPIESTISSEALGLLDCFSGGIGDFVYRMAELAAAHRTGDSGKVEIGVDDIKAATDRVVQIIKESPDVPAQIKADINDSLKCLSFRLQQCK